MGEIIFLVALVAAICGVVAAIHLNRKADHIAEITDTEEFAEGYELCIDVCKEIDGLHSARDAAESYQKEEFTANKFGFVCAYCDITGSSRPKPWGKANG